MHGYDDQTVEDAEFQRILALSRQEEEQRLERMRQDAILESQLEEEERETEKALRISQEERLLDDLETPLTGYDEYDDDEDLTAEVDDELQTALQLSILDDRKQKEEEQRKKREELRQRRMEEERQWALHLPQVSTSMEDDDAEFNRALMMSIQDEQKQMETRRREERELQQLIEQRRRQEQMLEQQRIFQQRLEEQQRQLELQRRKEEQERIQRESIRRIQDEEYLESLRRDQDKERKRQRQEREDQLRRKEEQERVLQMRQEEEERQELENALKLSTELHNNSKVERLKTVLPPEPVQGNDTTEIRIRWPDGSNINRRFHSSDKLQSLKDFIDIKNHETDKKIQNYSIVCPYPKRVFEDLKLTFEEAQLAPRAVVNVEVSSSQ